MSALDDPRPIQEVRQRMIPLAQGEVLEISVGPGVNFVHYDHKKVNKVYALEPNPGMIRLAEQHRRRTELHVEFLDLPGERIPLEDCSVDSVVSTFTLCTIPGVEQAIRGIGRVLRPGGRFIFFKHGLSSDARTRRWQECQSQSPIGCSGVTADEGVRLLPALTGSAKVGRVEFDELGTPEDGVVHASLSRLAHD